MRFPPPLSFDIWHSLNIKLERLAHSLYSNTTTSFSGFQYYIKLSTEVVVFKIKIQRHFHEQFIFFG